MGGVQEEKAEVLLQLAGVETLLSNEVEVPLACIQVKTTCLFFSAQWCRPCRDFTPKLLHLYTTLRSAGESIEIIFVSLDHDERRFSEHFSDMPWLAVPFDAALSRRLCARFDVGRIPALVPLSLAAAAVAAEGGGDDAAEEDAVELVEEYGVEAFPFGERRRRELEAMDEGRREGGRLGELLGCRERDYVICRDGAQVPISDLVGTTVGLYFAAHWCPPCRAFTTMLAEAYNEVKSSKSGRFEIVFISMDRGQDEFQASLDEMPWLAVPYADPMRRELRRIFAVKGIPSLVILGPDGKALRTDGRSIITSYGAMAFPFTSSRASEVEAALRKEGEGLPRRVRDRRHEHELELDTAKAYLCDVCRRQGRYWVFSCKQCNFDLHPSCIEGTEGNKN